MIQADHVTVLFPRGLRRKPIRALDGFSVTVNRGDVFGLLGPNGAGKSTAMYCFLGLIRPTQGFIRVAGEEPLPGSRAFERVVYVPEEPHYHLYLTVFEALRYYTGLYEREVPRSCLEDAIRRVGLTEFRDLRLDKCSKGMKQKLGIAMCLIAQPELVFLDEPTRGLDPVIVKEFRDIILEMNRQGTTFVINSHILSEVEMVCNRVAIMDHGRVIMQDDLRQLLKYDLETYAVEFSGPDGLTLPDFMTATPPLRDMRRGTLPAQHLSDFMRFAETSGIKIWACSLKRQNLEEAFFNVLKGGPAG
jgi:ABC-2 type transport system ATP-binding protein